MSGHASCGRPGGISPTTAMPCRSRSNSALTAVAAVTAISAPGSRGAFQRSTRISPNVTSPIARVAAWISSRLVTNSPTRGKKVSASIGTPVSFCNWLDSKVSPTPVM